MSPFEMMMQRLIGGLGLYENDPGFGFHLFQLPGEQQARIFRTARAKRLVVKAPPTKGAFVTVCTHPKTGQVVLGFCVFPPSGGPSDCYALLAYDVRELNKGIKHTVEWLAKGVLPVADGEFAEGEEHVVSVSTAANDASV